MENVFNFIMDLFVGDGVIIAVGAFVTGQIIKSLNKVDNKYIPLVGGLLGIALGITIPGVFGDINVISKGIHGLALGWAATGGYETIHQLFRKEQ